MSCKYCDTYQTARERRWHHPDVRTRVSERFCPIINGWTFKQSTACDGLVIARYFHCDLRKHTVAVIACLSARKTNRTAHCNNMCAQSKEVMGFCRGVNLFSLHGGKQTARNFKPKLKLRKNA